MPIIKIGSTCPDFEAETLQPTKKSIPEADSHRVPRGGRLAAIPYGAGIIERLERSIPILDGVVDHPVSADGVKIVLVPAAQVIAVAGYETLRKRAPGR